MQGDSQHLENCPDFVSVSGMFKATPHEESGNRYVYMEASNEGLDQQGEVVAAKALEDSAPYFLRYGNIDIDHITRLGPKLNIPEYASYEIGQPAEVRQRDGRTFVKAQIYTGETDAAARANMFWKSVAEVRPAHRWYPSVGGPLLAKSTQVDPSTQARRTVLTKVRWNNIGMSKTPVNQHVGTCAVIPIGEFAKSLTADGLLDITKALTAGYGTDSADLTGGAALREQSIDAGPANYWHIRDHLAGAIRSKACGQTARELCAYAETTFKLPHDAAAEHVERFLGDLRRGLQQRKAA